jgi:outer membrane protein assembly factor BamE (lipoprotein component of BamABCDE complex)
MPVALFAVSILLAGCIIIPVPTPEHSTASSRAFIEAEEIARIQPGKTTREEILLRYGAPDAALKNQQLFVYSWDRIAAYLLVAWGAPEYGGGGETVPVGREHTLFIEFDEDNIVRRVALKEGTSLDKDSVLRQFEADQPR